MKKSFPKEIYEKVNIYNLILVSFYNLEKKNKKTCFEDLLKECFNLFPDRFNFSKRPRWPDSRKLDRPLRTLRKRKLIRGNPKDFFSLTGMGRKKAFEALNYFRQRKLKLR